MPSQVAEFKCSHREHRSPESCRAKLTQCRTLGFFSEVLIMVSQTVSNLICWSTNSIQALTIMFELTNCWFSRLQALLIQAFL